MQLSFVPVLRLLPLDVVRMFQSPFPSANIILAVPSRAPSGTMESPAVILSSLWVRGMSCPLTFCPGLLGCELWAFASLIQSYS